MTRSGPVTCPGTFDGTIFEVTVSQPGSSVAAADVLLDLGGNTASGLDYFVVHTVGSPGSTTVTIVDDDG